MENIAEVSQCQPRCEVGPETLHGVATCGVGAVELPEKVSVGGWYAANDAHISHEALTTG